MKGVFLIAFLMVSLGCDSGSDTPDPTGTFSSERLTRWRSLGASRVLFSEFQLTLTIEVDEQGGATLTGSCLASTGPVAEIGSVEFLSAGVQRSSTSLEGTGTVTATGVALSVTGGQTCFAPGLDEMVGSFEDDVYELRAGTDAGYLWGGASDESTGDDGDVLILRRL